MKKLNKLTSLFLAAIMALSVLTIAPFTVSAAERDDSAVSADFTSGNYKYEVYDDGTAGIIDYLGNETNIVTPTTLDGHKVTQICTKAFYKCNASVVTISEGVTVIDQGAFAYCPNLKTLNLPSSVYAISTINLVYCSDNLTEINVNPNNTQFMSKDGVLFGYNEWTDKYTLCFYPQSKAGETYTIPDFVSTVTYGAFTDNTKYLKHINIGDKVEEIIGIFYCQSLESITVDENNTVYSSQDGVLFSKDKTQLLCNPRNNSTTKYVIPDTVVNCAGFNGCNTIEEITFSNKMTYIRNADCAYCPNLKKITLSDSITEIGNGAFYECPNLTSVTIPKTVTKIGSDAFGYVGSDKKVSGFTIKGYSGTAAETYANENGFTFVNLGATSNNPTSVKVNRSTLTLGVGESYGIVKTISPSNATQTCTWSSSNSSVASVDSNGKVTAKKAGTANITVKTSNGLTATCKVTVKPAPTSVKISNTSLTLGKGETFTVSQSTNSGSYAWGFSWSSSNTNVATVTKGSGNKATITAKGTGTATITIKTYNGKTATCKVTVKPAPTSVKTNPTSVTLGKGETYTISEVTNSGSYANASNLKWSTTNSSVATVTKGSGNKATITAKGVGTAYVKITLYNGKTATCKVTVKPAPASVTTNPTSVTLGKGETYTISEVTNSGSYANASNLKWSTTNSSVATVTKGSGNKAKITAKGVGTAYVKITLYNGKTATCKVTVKPAPTSVKLSKTSITLKKGQTYTISESTNSGSYANASNLKWSTTNSSVATVTKGSANKATITAKAKGTTYIKITLYNGKTAQCKVTVK